MLLDMQKKSTVSAIMFIGYCVGGTAGPQFFKTSQHDEGLVFLMMFVTFVMILALVLRVYLVRGNKRRDRAGPTGPLFINDHRTDKEMENLRYAL